MEYTEDTLLYIEGGLLGRVFLTLDENSFV